LGVGIAEYPLPELSRIENVLDADVTRGPITGLLITFHVGNVPSGGEGHIGDLVLALCLVGRVFVFVQRPRGGVCEDGSPGVSAGPILLDGLVEARLGFGTRSVVRTCEIMLRALVGRGLW